MPRGGARPGAGRKRKTDAERWLAGNAGKLSDVPKERPKPRLVRLITAPAELTTAETDVWNRLAPHAAAARTLVAGTVEAFAMLCRAIVIERQLGYSPTERGGSSHRGMMQRVEAGFLRFRLSPIGKELDVPDEEHTDEFAEFDGTVQ